MKTILACSVAVALLSSGSINASDDEGAGKLKGDYALTFQEDCVFSVAGFGPAPLFLALGPTTRGTATTQGIASFNKDGTGEIRGRNLFIGTNPNNTPALGMTVSCPLNYTVDDKGAFDAAFNCTGVATLGSGSQTSLQTFQNGMRLTGHAQGKKTILAATTNGAIEEVGSSAAPNAVARICHRSAQFIKIEKTEE